MGWVGAALQQAREMLGLPRPLRTVAVPSTRYDAARPIDQLIGAMLSSGVLGGSISREQALSIMSLKRARNELASIATLPLRLYRGAEVIPAALFQQFDPDVPNVVHLAMTIEDLMMDAVAWWRITRVDYDGYPIAVRRLDPASVSLQPPGGRDQERLPGGYDPRGAAVWVNGERVDARSIIRFDSPNPGVLRVDARTIRRALLLDELAAMYADNPRPLDYFTAKNDPNVDEMDDDEIEPFLAEWNAYRKRRATGWIPGNVERVDVTTPSPAEIQLVELQRQVTLEIANGAGVDPEDLGVSTTSRTYFNAQDRRTDKVNRTFMPMMRAITDRLSMNDVTRRGYATQFDLTGYLQADPAGRVAYYQGMSALIGLRPEWIAQQEGIPMSAITGPATPAAAPAPEQNSLPPVYVGELLPARAALTAAAGTRATFDGPPAMTFAVRDFAAAGVDPAPRVDTQRRTITGLALPYNAIAEKFGVRYRFRPGSLEYDADNLQRLKHLQDHVTPVGFHTDVKDTAAGPVVTLSVLDGPEGSPVKAARDQLLYDAEHGLYDGLSVGVYFDMDPAGGDVEWNDKDQVLDVLRATWQETSTTPLPAFTDARVTKVAASMNGGFPMFCQHCGQPHAPGVACHVARQQAAAAAAQQQYAAQLSGVGIYPPATPVVPAAAGLAPQQYDALQQPPAAPAQQPAQPPAPQQGQFAAQLPVRATEAELNAALSTLAASIAPQQQPETRPVVDPTRQTFAGAQVTEAEPYRLVFDARGMMQMRPGTHDFSRDLHAFWANGDMAAHDRALSWVQRHFDIVTTNVDELNPTRQRPEMYVDQRTYRYPMWEAINKGSLTDITPFTFPKFNSASGLVGNHTEGVEPTSGALTTTSQTVTPSAISGKAKISREVWDQGGNPQISTLIWNQMVKGWFEALEAAAVALLDAASPTSLGTLTAGNADTGQTLSTQVEDGMAKLQFVRGGFSMTDAFAQADLYTALRGAKDDAGRPLYPVIGPSNANGTTQSRFGAIDIGGVLFYPAWALAAAGQTAAASSYLFDREDVHGWASAPQRLTMDNAEVANVYLGIWGYKATAISDINGVREIIWDPVA